MYIMPCKRMRANFVILSLQHTQSCCCNTHDPVAATHTILLLQHTRSCCCNTRNPVAATHKILSLQHTRSCRCNIKSREVTMLAGKWACLSVSQYVRQHRWRCVLRMTAATCECLHARVRGHVHARIRLRTNNRQAST